MSLLEQTSAPIKVLECYSPASLENHELPTDRPTNQPTDEHKEVTIDDDPLIFTDGSEGAPKRRKLSLERIKQFHTSYSRYVVYLMIKI